ncbi:MAG TPA: hypothetical protein QGF58_04590 [Myxococcota bacterium]|nr:hypothetical protein [Myxococcota bacterium]
MRHRRRHLLYVACVGAAVLACGGGRTPADSGVTERPGGGGGESDDSTWSDDSEQGGGWGSPCPKYSGMKEGASWSWQYTDEYVAEVGQDAAWWSEVRSINGSNVVVEYEGEIENGSFDYYTYGGTSTYRCDGGMYLVGSETRADYSISGTVYWSESVTTYAGGGWMVLPEDPAAGDTWSNTVSGTTATSSSSGPDQQQDYTWSLSYEIAEGGDVDTPAGTFTDTLEIISDNDGSVSSSLADKHAGTVYIGESAELLSWSD